MKSVVATQLGLEVMGHAAPIPDTLYVVDSSIVYSCHEGCDYNVTKSITRMFDSSISSQAHLMPLL
jgi:hypothetical protein